MSTSPQRPGLWSQSPSHCSKGFPDGTFLDLEGNTAGSLQGFCHCAAIPSVREVASVTMKSMELYSILPKLRSNTDTVTIHQSHFLGKRVTDAPHTHREGKRTSG